jgi:D-threonine aldolase
MTASDWYTLTDEANIDSPALIIYKDRVRRNIDTLVNSIDHVNRLRPHVKTHKSPEVIRMFMAKGIRKFKCATIAEAEMLAGAGVTDILLAYQPVGPKAERLYNLVVAFPQITFSCLIDNPRTATALSTLFAGHQAILDYYIDVNVGMNRTGILPEDVPALVQEIRNLKGLRLRGLHVYDGHIRDQDFSIRKKRCDEAFDRVARVDEQIRLLINDSLTTVAGGTPTFSVHAMRKDIECSPGTFIYWDKGYERILPEQHYLHAALVLTRVISRPTHDTVCVDLGHKSIASENTLHDRVFFLNAPDLTPVGHSEEHMVLQTNGMHLDVGDVLYGVPYHVCPTIALYESTQVAVDNKIAEAWQTLSRNRKINI